MTNPKDIIDLSHVDDIADVVENLLCVDQDLDLSDENAVYKAITDEYQDDEYMTYTNHIEAAVAISTGYKSEWYGD
jgi:hypothetical protein